VHYKRPWQSITEHTSSASPTLELRAFHPQNGAAMQPWLEGRPARLVLALESAARYRALGSHAAREWAAIRDQMREQDAAAAPCVGWLCDEVAGYGRGVHPVDVAGGLVVAALGDPSREPER